MAETPQGNPFDPGVFNFAQIMEDFYSSSGENASEDERLQKAAFQGTLVQTGFDAMLASSLAQQNSAIAQENMTTQAMLEKSNAQDLMQSEFGFNELSKESNFNYENNFANAQFDRDIGMLSATGQQQRDNIREQSDQDRLTNIVQGEQQRLTDAQNLASQERIASGRYAADTYQADAAAQASRDVAETQKESAETTTGLRTAADENIASTAATASMYGSREAAEAQKEVASTQRKSARETTGIRSGADVKIGARSARAQEYGAREAAGASKFGAKAQLAGVKDTNKTSTKNIRVTGDETRTTMDRENRLKAKDRADMSRYSRGLARAN